MKALFLDVDGVLNSKDWFTRRGDRQPEHGDPGSFGYLAARQLDPVAVRLMNDVVERTGCTVVLSSSWRINGLERSKEVLRLAGATFELFDATPDCAQLGPGSLYVARERGGEINEWLEGHPEVTRFAIVDDSDDMGPLANHLIRTTWDWGLTMVEAKALIEALGVKDAD